AAYATALAAAFQKAKAKATTLAAQAGTTLGQALTINEGGKAEIVPFEDKAAAAPTAGCGTTSQPAGPVAKRADSTVCAPAPPTKPGVSTVTGTVGVIFALQ
ncbi:MAG TPA: SIMPL domain-containing protein, partial [Solirubrobacterales bacterium]|nr:SIMPL domain-containing protein [Solirubrobacterales bacterium]